MNPEAIRFPSNLRVKILLLSALAVDLLCAGAALYIGGSVDLRFYDATVITVLVVVKLYFWPREIVLDQFGIHSLGLFARLNTHIPWNEIGEVRSSTEVPGFGPLALGCRNDTLEFLSATGTGRAAHTSHHPDRDRLVREARLRGVAINDSALT
jgi:hypothetical protein